MPITYLRKKKLVEGRKPNLFLAKSVAQNADQKIEYSQNKGMEDSYYCDLLLTTMKDHKLLTKQEIIKLLFNKLPDSLSDTQKEHKIQNLLTKLRKQGKIQNEVRGTLSKWWLNK